MEIGGGNGRPNTVSRGFGPPAGRGVPGWFYQLKPLHAYIWKTVLDSVELRQEIERAMH